MKNRTRTSYRHRPEVVSGFLEIGVGANNGQVIVVHRNMKSNAEGYGFVGLSPEQARNLAHVLLRKAGEAEQLASTDNSDSPDSEKAPKGAN